MGIWSKLVSLLKSRPRESNPAPKNELSDLVRARLAHYLQDPSPEGFLQLRDEVAASPPYAPYTSKYKAVAFPLLESGEFEEAKNHLISMMPSYFLNPGIHKYTAYALQKLGAETSARFEYSLAALFLRGILSTGDGSKERPYLVLYIEDEYDVLGDMKKKLRKQALVKIEGRYCDCLDCEDGSQIWFDITTPFAHEAARRGITLSELFG